MIKPVRKEIPVTIARKGTVMVKDITAGSASSIYYYLTGLGDHLYFVGNDPVHGSEPWISDGTEAGTHILKDIVPGVASSGASPAVSIDAEVFFTVSTQSTFELWKSDGTEAGTVEVKNNLPQRSGHHHAGLTVANNALYFTAGEYELWTSDGTAGGTVVVKQFGADVPIQILGANGTTLFMSAGDHVTSQELWKSDGTEAGTVIVKDINADGPSSPEGWAGKGPKSFFSANDGIDGKEIWITDGNEAGTVMLKNINTSLKYSPVEFKSIQNNLFFINHRSETTYEVWKSNGTTDGTVLVKDINPDAVSFSGGGVQASENRLFMVLDDGEHGFEVWVSDGSADGTKLLKDIRPGPESSSSRLPENKAVLNGDLFFRAADGGNGEALWKTDGTEAGTVKVKSISAFINSMLPVGNVLYFVTGSALWKSDGTAAGTTMVKEVNPTHSGYAPAFLYNVGGTLYFTATDGVHGVELWKSDGTEAGTVMVKDVHLENTDHYMSITGDVNGKVIFSAAATGFDYELWISDGTEAGTVLLKDINTQAGSFPWRISQDDNFVFFTASDVDHGNELWKTDGTSEGTTLVKDLWPGVQGSFTTHGTIYKGQLYFSANDGSHGAELWRTDGSTEGTKLMMDINPGEASSAPDYFTVNGNALFFRADDGIHGREAWKLEKITQAITFDPLPNKVANDAPFVIQAIASSGLQPAFTIVSGPAAISGNIVTLTGAGEVIVRASQPGNDFTDPALSVDRSFQVSKASQTISFSPLAPKKTNDAPFVVTATSTSGLPVSFSIVSGPATIAQSTVTLTGAGEVAVKAYQTGNEIYKAAADVVQSFSVELIVALEGTNTRLVNLYPNPASDVLHINLSESQYTSIRVLNSTGQKVWESDLKIGDNDITIQINDWAPGIYLLRVQRKNDVTLEKLIVH